MIEEIDDTAISETELKLQYLEEAIKKLSPEEHFLVSLYYMENQSIGEIAQVTQLSESNIKIKLYRTRQKLGIEINKLMS